MDNAQNNVRNQLDGMNYALVDFQRVGQFAERFRHFMDYEAKIESRPGTVTLPPAAKRADAALAIENLTFRYEGAAADTLTDVSLTVRPGERVAIVGENGAGKSTFIKLLMRLYEPTAGSIRYAGRDCREYSTNDWRSLFGAVFQDYQLYGTSLAENVIMGERADVSRPAETRPQQDERVRRALELADFDRKLAKLPHGLDTEMTREFDDDGTMLSGGESQKVAISRMFAKSLLTASTKPNATASDIEASPAGATPNGYASSCAHGATASDIKTGPAGLNIAILDEPSSALDPRAESALNKNMLAVTANAAVIFISHRLSTTRDADRIYLFERGRIVEQGTHEELMQLNGGYAAMFEKQAHYYQEEA
jgi:ATP-binding cassette subfamily B protein